MGYKKYTDEFKREVLAMQRKAAAASLGLSANWISRRG